MIIKEKIALAEIAPKGITFIKIVVDLDREVIAYGLEYHADCADELVEDGSAFGNCWGANIFPQTKTIDFVSLINIRPAANNRGMTIVVPEVLAACDAIIKKMITW